MGLERSAEIDRRKLAVEMQCDVDSHASAVLQEAYRLQSGGAEMPPDYYDRWRFSQLLVMKQTAHLGEVPLAKLARVPPVHRMLPKFSLADEITRVVEGAGLAAVDLSGELTPSMTMKQYNVFWLELILKLRNNDNRVYFVTLDHPNAYEFLSYRKKQLTHGLDVGDSPLQAIVHRGEDHATVLGQSKLSKSSIKQQLAMLVDSCAECCVCLESPHDMHGSYTTMAPFDCGHQVCTKCFAGVIDCGSCPSCRTTKLAPAFSSVDARKHKKKAARAAQRR